MPTTENLATQYHQQDTSYYCGAACAQMVLEQCGAGLLDQDGLYTDNHNHSTTEGGWYTAPDGLTWTLNNRQPAGSSRYFVLFALGNEDSISRKIVWTIHHYGVAPVALVYGWQHWIVVRGFEASAAPTNYADTSYSITALHINNPWPPTPAPAPPPPHTSGDACGSGGTRGVADEHVAYSTWQSTYMTGVPGGHWSGQFVAVCDPEPPPERINLTRPHDEQLPGDRLLGRAAALRYVEVGLKKYGLYEQSPWRDALEGTKPGDPLLVQELNHSDRFYYIVPMQAGKRVPVLTSVDARFGTYRQTVVLSKRGSMLLPADRREILGQVIDKKFELENRMGRLLVRREAVCLQPTLVWKPCRESLSPFWPFYLLSVGDQHLYVRLDGAVFTNLHDDEHGI